MLTISSLDQNAILLILSAMIFIYSSILVKFKPFLDPTLNNLEYLACFYLFIGIFLNALITQSDSVIFIYFLNIFLLFTNLFFFTTWSVKYLRYFILKHKPWFQAKFPKIAKQLLKLYSTFTVKDKYSKEKIDENSKKMLISFNPRQTKVLSYSIKEKKYMRDVQLKQPGKAKQYITKNPSIKVSLNFSIQEIK